MPQLLQPREDFKFAMSIPILAGAREETPFENVVVGEGAAAKERAVKTEGDDWICKDILNMVGWERREYILL